MEPDEFRQLLRQYDTGWQYSDDPQQHRKGKAQHDRLAQLAKSCPVLEKIWQGFVGAGFKPALQ